MVSNLFKRDNGRDHRAAAIDIVFKSRAARGSVCNVLLSVAIPASERLLVGLHTGCHSPPW